METIKDTCIKQVHYTPEGCQSVDVHLATEETVRPLRLSGRSGPEISKPYYESVKQFILSHVSVKGGITLDELLRKSSSLHTCFKFPGDVNKLVLIVKEDLQVRGIITVKLEPAFIQRISLRNRGNKGASNADDESSSVGTHDVNVMD